MYSVNQDADCIWIVEDAQLKVMVGGSVVWRGPGEIVGEMAFPRGRPEEAPLRGYEVVAAGQTKVWKIDRAALDGLEPSTRALWYETVGAS